MAIFYLRCTPVQRSHGRTATAAAAYRSGTRLYCARTGVMHDYRHRSGVLSAGLFLPEHPPAWARSREALWNAAERADTRVNSTPAREYTCALPAELSEDAQLRLAAAFARDMVTRLQCAADLAVHLPSHAPLAPFQAHARDLGVQNVHLHLLTSTRELRQEGFGPKTLIEQAGRPRAQDLQHTKHLWEALVNAHLTQAGTRARVSALPYPLQGVPDLPTVHLGPGDARLVREGKSSERETHNAATRHHNALHGTDAAHHPRVTARPTPGLPSLADLLADLAGVLPESL